MRLLIDTGTMTLEKHLELLTRLNEEIETADVDYPPFTFDVLDTPNREIAMATVHAGLAGQYLNMYITKGDEMWFNKAETSLTYARRNFPPNVEEKLKPPILSDGWLAFTTLLKQIVEYQQLPKPPGNLTVEQYKNLTASCKLMWSSCEQCPKRILSWRNRVFAWIKRETMHNMAYQIKLALDQKGDTLDVPTTAKRMHDILEFLR